MIGITLIIVLYFYVRVAIWVAKWTAGRFESKKKKWIAQLTVALVFFLIPTGDAIIGHLYLDHLCATEAGVKVYQTMELPSEYWDEQGKPKFFNKQGYLDRDFLEKKLDESGGHTECYSTIFHIDKYVTPVTEKTSRKMLAEIITFRRWGGWISNNFSPNHTADSCEFIQDRNFSRNFYGQLFEPATSAR